MAGQGMGGVCYTIVTPHTLKPAHIGPHSGYFTWQTPLHFPPVQPVPKQTDRDWLGGVAPGPGPGHATAQNDLQEQIEP